MPEFHAPSQRATSSDLSIQISPLGLIELSDEEFEVHGPRLSRYAQSWAMYLGHHWSYKREAGEPQLTFNYVRALSDFITNFTFGRGVKFTTPKTTEAIVPNLLQRVWEVDNHKAKTLWAMGQLGSVTGDCPVKVAYEDPWVDPAGRVHRGRVRIIPLNPAFSFPEFHPHDRNRLIRFKLKYRFWNCVDPETEILTASGWKKYDEVSTNDAILSRNPTTDAIQWEQPKRISVFDNAGAPLIQWRTPGVDALTTMNHRWLVDTPKYSGGSKVAKYEREIARTYAGLGDERAVKNTDRVLTGGGVPLAFADAPKYDDEFVETVAWFVTEGWEHYNQTGAHSAYLAQKRPEGLRRIRRVADYWRRQGATFSEYAAKPDGVVTFYLGKGVKEPLFEAAPKKAITPEFLCALTATQAEIFRDTLLLADGYRPGNFTRWTQTDQGRVDGYQMLCAMLGIGTRYAHQKVSEYARGYSLGRTLRETATRVEGVDTVWCPELSEETGIWFARRNGITYWTGNTSDDGTRQVSTYVEILTDELIEEYIDDQLIDSRPNTLGQIPVVFIPNIPVEGSPWGLSDINDVVPLNREYNEKATDLSDIINYYAAPVTVITGAKANQLEKGPKKVWGNLPKDASVFNLEMTTNLSGPLAYMETLKQAMHEMTGVPAGALGEKQQISNTSGVALAIQYQPMMNRFSLKTNQYGFGIERINELVLLTLAVKEPQSLQFNPFEESHLKPGQLAQLDPHDPITYQTTADFPPPLPTDILIKLNEIQAKMELGLESKRGALRELGEEFPDERTAEIYEELREDIMSQGALDLLRTSIQLSISAALGIPLDGDEDGGGGSSDVASAGGAGVTHATGNATSGTGTPEGVLPGAGSAMPGVAIPSDPAELLNQLVTRAYGTKLAQRRKSQDRETS